MRADLCIRRLTERQRGFSLFQRDMLTGKSKSPPPAQATSFLVDEGQILPPQVKPAAMIALDLQGGSTMAMASLRREILVLVVFKSDCQQSFEKAIKYHL